MLFFLSNDAPTGSVWHFELTIRHTVRSAATAGGKCTSMRSHCLVLARAIPVASVEMFSNGAFVSKPRLRDTGIFARRWPDAQAASIAVASAGWSCPYSENEADRIIHPRMRVLKIFIVASFMLLRISAAKGQLSPFRAILCEANTSLAFSLLFFTVLKRQGLTKQNSSSRCIFILPRILCFGDREQGLLFGMIAFT
jgi:hypothetical protein